MSKLASIAKEILLEENILVKQPFWLFRRWWAVVNNTKDILEPTMGCLGTINKNGNPTNRIMDLREIRDDGYTIYTHFASLKSAQIAANSKVSLSFYWRQLRHSVRIEGVANKLEPEESECFFRNLPREIQFFVHTSVMDTKLASREELDKRVEDAKREFGKDKLPMPNWGGYLIEPCVVEFWQAHPGRLPDRIRFRRGPEAGKDLDNKLVHCGENGWVYERLVP